MTEKKVVKKVTKKAVAKKKEVEAIVSNIETVPVQKDNSLQNLGLAMVILAALIYIVYRAL